MRRTVEITFKTEIESRELPDSRYIARALAKLIEGYTASIKYGETISFGRIYYLTSDFGIKNSRGPDTVWIDEASAMLGDLKKHLGLGFTIQDTKAVANAIDSLIDIKIREAMK